MKIAVDQRDQQRYSTAFEREHFIRRFQFLSVVINLGRKMCYDYFAV